MRKMPRLWRGMEFAVNIYMKRDVILSETDKVVEIKDNTNVLKFKVVLSKSEELDVSDNSSVDDVFYEDGESEPNYIEVFQVVVLNDKNEELYTSVLYKVKRDADLDFERQLRNYTYIVKSQTKPIDAIEFYSKEIEYRYIDPDCCANCEFCRYESDGCRHSGNRRHLVCVNPCNFTFFQNMVHPVPYRDVLHRDFDYGFHPSMRNPVIDGFLPCPHEPPPPACGQPHPLPPPDVPPGPSFHSLEVRPRVDFNGICKNYKRKIKRPNPPRPRPVA